MQCANCRGEMSAMTGSGMEHYLTKFHDITLITYRVAIIHIISIPLCFRFNPGAIPERAPDVDPLTGEAEWPCPVCGVSNFYKRFDCYRCFEKKPLDGVMGGF